MFSVFFFVCNVCQFLHATHCAILLNNFASWLTSFIQLSSITSYMFFYWTCFWTTIQESAFETMQI